MFIAYRLSLIVHRSSFTQFADLPAFNMVMWPTSTGVHGKGPLRNTTTVDRLTHVHALERTRYRLAELGRYAYAAGIDCPDAVLQELATTRQLIASLEAAAVSVPVAAQVLK